MKKKILKFVSNRTFWINTLGGAALILDTVNPVLPVKYIAAATMIATLINRFVKVIKEESK